MYTTLKKFFETSTTPQPSTNESKKPEDVLVERANLFEKAIVDNPLHCVPNDWKLIKKKIFDLFLIMNKQILTQKIHPLHLSIISVTLYFQTLQVTQTMDILVERMHNNKTINNQAQGFKIMRSIIKHHKILTTLTFHRAAAITLNEMSNIKRLLITFLILSC